MELLTYLLKVSACMVLFFAFYFTVLRKLTFFRINRFYLLTTLILSFVIPALQFSVEREAEVNQISAANPASELPVYALEQTQAIDDVIQIPVPKQEINWISVIPYTYLAVVVILLVFSIRQLFQLLIHANNHFREEKGLKLVSKTIGFTNCSFFNYVFVDENSLSEAELAVLLKHEEVHANQFHSIDKIILMVFKAVLWFNPIVYLFDKALEQVHEYEADEATSLNFGTGAYAKLLLKLAVSRSDMPLIHNFVKSPIKERIKMLFNSKSNNMKKLSYLLVLPVVIGLVWLFSVQVVYAQSQLKSEAYYQDTLRKKVSKNNKELALPNVKQTDPYYTSKEYLEKKKIAESSYGKTLTGTVMGDYKSKSKIGFDDGKLFESQGKTYILPKMYLGEQILNTFRTNDELKVVGAGTGFTRGEDFVYIQPKQIFSGNKLIYQMPKPEVYPFLYEANRVRFNDGKISSITFLGDKKIVNVIANGYNFKIVVNKSQTDLAYLNDYKKGNDVRLRFVHEVKTGAKSYAINDWISISKNIRTFGVQNKILFSKFYKEDGHQKVSETKKAASIIKRDTIRPKFISASKITGDTKSKISYFDNAVVSIFPDMLRAKYVEYIQKSNILIAKDATLEVKNGNSVIAHQIIFDLNKNTYSATNFESEKINNVLGRFNGPQKGLIENKISYSAIDSIKLSKDKNIIYLYGKARLLTNNVTIDADEIVYNSKTQLGSAKNILITQIGSGTKIKGSNATFNLNGKVEIWQNENGNVIVGP